VPHSFAFCADEWAPHLPRRTKGYNRISVALLSTGLQTDPNNPGAAGARYIIEESL